MRVGKVTFFMISMVFSMLLPMFCQLADWTY